MEPDPDARLTGEGLACIRGGRLVFAGLSFALAAGGALLLRGGNGAGKSSLLRLAAGLLAPAAGRLTWHGPHPAGPIGYLGHADAASPALTVLETVGFWQAVNGAPGGEAAARRALDRIGLGGRADLPVRYLSAGQRRRLALAQLLAVPAQLWLLDEPAAGLDDDGVARLQAALAGHRARGGMVMAATHTPIESGGPAAIDLDRFQPDAETARAIIGDHGA